MAERKTKTLANATELTSIADGQKLILADGNGKTLKISLANLKSALLANMSLNMMADNVFIMTHRCKTYNDNCPLAIKPEYWVSGYQSQGEVADGVLVIDGGRQLVIAPTESTDKLLWSSAEINCGAIIGDRLAAIADFNGKANTAKQIAASKDAAITNTANYAPGFCNLYSRANANGKGLTAGRWWLPSLGEMLMIYSNMNKINYALSLIEGATLLQRDWYWTSTEFSSTGAWHLNLNDGLTGWNTKASSKNRVRAVSAFLN